MHSESCFAESCYAESCHAELCYAEACLMSQPPTVTHRGGRLAYPTWAAHTTTCPALLAHGAGRCEGSGQADQGLRGLLLYIYHVGIGAPKAPNNLETKNSQKGCRNAHAPIVCPASPPEHTDGLRGKQSINGTQHHDPIGSTHVIYPIGSITRV
jgi:hypothetical protein